MARLFLNSGQTFGTVGAGLATNVFGTSTGNESVSVAADGDVIFDPSFNGGGDVINIGGNAALYTASFSGSNLILTSAAGANITIPFGTAGTTINFLDAANRVLRVSGSSVLLGSQTITAGGVAVSPGSGGNPDPDNTYNLTASTDIITGTGGADAFFAYLSQNPALGGVSNSISSADRLFGGGSTGDTLYAEVIPEFFSGTGDSQIDIQPTIRSIEDIDFEARDLAVSGNRYAQVAKFDSAPVWESEGPYTPNQIIIVDGKNMRDVDHIGSANSDGDLVIENLNTLTTGGQARNTESVTITMDHTDNFNSDDDASDLHVYFDDDYLLAGQSTTSSQANYWLLDEDSADYVNVPLLNVERNGVRFSIDGNPQTVRVADNTAGVPDSWEAYAQALQDDINDQIAAGNSILEGLTVVVDYNNTDNTFNDFGANVTIPAITILDEFGREFSDLGFITPEDSTGAFDIYGRVSNDPSEQFDNPVTVNIELTKVGRNGEGGDLIIGGKNGDKGIEVFKVEVLGVGDEDPSGDVAKPSNLGTLASTGGDLAEIYIVTAPEFVDGDTFASLTIRDGFGNGYSGFDNPSVPGSVTPNDLRLVDADGFLGDLSLGTCYRVVNLDTLTALGGGNILFRGVVDGNEVNQPYSYTTGSGSDVVDLYLDGDGLDYAQSSVHVSTNAGTDTVYLSTTIDETSSPNGGNPEPINQAILRNIHINTGANDDVVYADVGSGNTIIETESGNDVVYTDGGTAGARWAFNYDDANQPNPTSSEDLTGVQTSPMYLMGATVRVSLSGAGISDLTDGGGVMALFNGADADAIQADGYENGYEAFFTISQLNNGRSYFGDQTDVNDAIIAAIEGHPVLSKLLTVEIRENNTLVITSITSGLFANGDLEITVDQANWASVQQGNGVLAEARALSGNSSLTHTDIWGVDSATANAAAPTAKPGYVYDLLGPDETDASYNAELDAWYTNLGVNNADLLNTSSASTSETDNHVNLGTGNDLWVLSTDSNNPSIPTMTVSTGNALLNGESNEELILEDLFGNDTIMNFETGLYNAQANGGTTVVDTATVLLPARFTDAYEDGLDFINFLDYLTSQEDESVNTPSNPDSDVSHHIIPVTLDYNEDAVPTNQHDANEVVVVRFDQGVTSNTWASLNATTVQNLYNNSGTTTNDYGSLLDENFFANDEYDDTNATLATGVDPLLNTAKGILMVENGANLGEYKVFELSWNGNSDADGGADSGPDTNDYDGIVTATLIGTLDFGTSLTGLHEINLVGSETYNDLLMNGWAAVA